MADSTWATAGKIGVVLKGEYNPTVNYKVNDIVYYNKSSYGALVDNIGIDPTHNDTWQLVVEGGGANVPIADVTKAGIVKPDGSTITIDTDGTISATAGSSIANNWNGNGYNLIPYPYYEKTKTVTGITFTDNGDGTITVNGKASSPTFFNLVPTGYVNILPKGKYKLLSGETSGAVLVINFNGTQYNESNGVFEITEDKPYIMYLYISTSTPRLKDVVFKPMLVEVNEDGSYPTEYQRYASGNVELTDNLANKANKWAVDGAISTLTTTRWSGASAPYTYDLNIGSEYDVEVLIPKTLTQEQYEAYVSAQISSNGTDNLILAWGEKPAIDLPIIVRKVVK